MHNTIAAGISAAGMMGSLLTLIAETLRWKSYGIFSVATKIPVQIFGLKGPLALVSLFIYLIMAILLATETATSTVFYLCCSWSVLYFDLAMEQYQTYEQMFTHRIDKIIHGTNAVILVYSFIEMSFVPVTFLLAGSGLWGILVLLRVTAKAQEQSQNIKLKQQPR